MWRTFAERSSFGLTLGAAVPSSKMNNAMGRGLPLARCMERIKLSEPPKGENCGSKQIKSSKEWRRPRLKVRSCLMLTQFLTIKLCASFDFLDQSRFHKYANHSPIILRE
jgi:hypothetical protein